MFATRTHTAFLKRYTKPISVALLLPALAASLTYQLVSKPATAQGLTYSLSGKAAKSATATPAATLLAQFSQQGPKLVGTGAAGLAAQGLSVALSDDGNTAIVGGPIDNNSRGAAWVWTRTGGVWTQQGTKLVGSGARGGDHQGWSVALSADGNTAIVGSHAGAWVWTRTGGVWTQQGDKLVNGGVNTGGQTPQQSQLVSLSADGNTAIVSWGGTAVWTRSGGVWTKQGPQLVESGNAPVSLSADGNTAIVGWGGITVWTRSGGVWTQQGPQLVGSGAGAQGTSVSLSADGNTAIVGGSGDIGTAGAAWIWTRTGGVWTQQGPKLVLIGSGAGFSDQVVSVSLSANGNTAIVSGSVDNDFVGTAWVWMRTGGVWTEQGPKLVGFDAVGNALQGVSVSLSADGSTAIVGGYNDNGFAGAAWVYTAASPVVCTLACNAIVPATATINAQVPFIATTTLANCTGAPTYEWNFGDGTANSTQQNPSHTYARAGTFTWTLTVKGPSGTTCAKTGTITASYGCTLGCAALVADKAVINAPASFMATTMLSNCTGTPTYEWSFGDGSAPVKLQNPKYTYTKAGRYTWKLTVVGPQNTTCIKTGIIEVATGCTVPVIEKQPDTVIIPFGRTATLSVIANGTAPFQFQWYEGNSGNTAKPITSATTQSFTTPALTTNKNYWARVTNACGQVSSRSAGVIVSAPESLTIDTIDPACDASSSCKGAYLTDSLRGVWLTSDLNKLATASVKRAGVVADGVTLLLLRVRSNSPVTFKLEGSPATGLLLPRLGGSGGGSQTVANAETVGANSFAFAVYAAPLDFPQSIDEVRITATSATGAGSVALGDYFALRLCWFTVFGAARNRLGRG